MVWDLATMKRMNDRAVEKFEKNGKPKHKKARIPPEIAGKPVLVRNYLNRPWNDNGLEKDRKKDDAAKAFADRELTEKPRT